MTKRQYLLQHILHLSAELSKADNPRHKQNIEQALYFYSRELRRLESEHRQEYKQ